MAKPRYRIYHLDPSSGALTYAATVAGAGTVNPSFLTLGRAIAVYTRSTNLQERSLERDFVRLSIDPATGHLSYLNEQSTHGTAPAMPA